MGVRALAAPHSSRNSETVDAPHRDGQPYAQCLARAAHGQLLHAVDKDQACARSRLHGAAYVQLGRLGQPFEIELYVRAPPWAP